ncbi:hypothetical protein JAAARDRAFT_201251 [Jaapia argillacea MUCL 33604]|uniref:Uncharacterized protein n=1 Tax=Jaapia argillacea MUCL 33604 TaxID=933084 RepID=A0A067PEU0_9AGAM|nr:hypothetical protein JAAARDRAFT_201251 [Jaapia argillacea MUCL 33604]
MALLDESTPLAIAHSTRPFPQHLGGVYGTNDTIQGTLGVEQVPKQLKTPSEPNQAKILEDSLQALISDGSVPLGLSDVTANVAAHLDQLVATVAPSSNPRRWLLLSEFSASLAQHYISAASTTIQQLRDDLNGLQHLVEFTIADPQPATFPIIHLWHSSVLKFTKLLLGRHS